MAVRSREGFASGLGYSVNDHAAWAIQTADPIMLEVSIVKVLFGFSGRFQMEGLGP